MRSNTCRGLLLRKKRSFPISENITRPAHKPSCYIANTHYPPSDLMHFDFDQMASECAPAVVPTTPRAMAAIESGFNSYAIGVVGDIRITCHDKNAASQRGNSAIEKP